ncbi:MAG: hypothetical protein AB7P03_06510 [Kofleriaceae bacterium]
MRLAMTLLVAVASCAPSPGSECHRDSQCSDDEVCARDDRCWLTSSVRTAEVTWTVHGMPANTVSCGSFQDLFIEFYSGSEDIGYAPVPCRIGKFTVLNLPEPYDEVELGVDGGWTTSGWIDAQGAASFDLLFVDI